VSRALFFPKVGRYLVRGRATGGYSTPACREERYPTNYENPLAKQEAHENRYEDLGMEKKTRIPGNQRGLSQSNEHKESAGA